MRGFLFFFWCFFLEWGGVRGGDPDVGATFWVEKMGIKEW